MSNNDDEQKKLAYYSATINAWINTKMEKDKSILILSSGGIGLLITLLTTIGIKSIFVLILFIISLILFLITVVSIVLIFDKNAEYLRNCLKDNNIDKNKEIKILDKISNITFFTAIIFSLLIGLSAGLQSIQKIKGAKMVNKENKPTYVPDEEKSLDGFEDLKPDTSTETDSDSSTSEENNSDSE